MAAQDTFHHFNADLPEDIRTAVADTIRQTGEDLFAARSEDARVRIVETYLREVNAKASRPERTPRAG
jgi:hypothetical protein